MSATIRDVSEKCGLSISTVSKALNNYSDVSEATRRLVADTAREIGYFPNALARALKTNRSYNIGVLFADDFGSGLTHAFFSAVLDSFKRTTEENGFDITFINHKIGHSGMTFLEHCKYRNVDGVCLACVDFFNPEVIELMASGFPAVTIDHVFNNRTCVMSDNIQGMHDLVEYVHRMGHTRVAYIHGQRNPVTESRITGFYRAMQEYGLAVAPQWMIPAEYQNGEHCYTAVKRLLSGGGERPTCVLMPDDYAAVGGINAIREAGLCIPEDISVVGYDGYPIMQMLSPRITTLRQDTKRIGEEAANALVDWIDHPHTVGSRTIVVAGQLIEGETVRNLNAQ